MLLYLTWFFASVIICYATLHFKRKTQIRVSTIYLMALGLFVGLGDMLGGYDRYIYGELFDSMANTTMEGGNPWLSEAFAFYGTEFGYGTLSAILTYVTANRYIYIFIVTIIIYILLIISLRRYVDNMPFAVIMFMGLWVFFTFTYLRQVLSCTIVWLAVQYIIDRSLWRFLLIVLIAYSFHNSAIVFVPIYFLPMRKYTPKQVMPVMGLAFLLGLTPIPQAMFATYGEVNADRISVESYANDAGFRIAYFIEALFFLWVILTNYEKISERRRDLVMLNLSLIFCAILLIFIRSENGGRLGWAFMIGVICTLTNICILNKQILKQGAFLIFVCLFLFLRVYNGWQLMMGLYPYKTFLTDGSREGDPIRAKYEYDLNYDRDKFYR